MIYKILLIYIYVMHLLVWIMKRIMIIFYSVLVLNKKDT